MLSSIFVENCSFLEDKKRKKLWNFARSHTVERVYARVTELVGLFGELVILSCVSLKALYYYCFYRSVYITSNLGSV